MHGGSQKGIVCRVHSGQSLCCVQGGTRAAIWSQSSNSRLEHMAPQTQPTGHMFDTSALDCCHSQELVLMMGVQGC